MPSNHIRLSVQLATEGDMIEPFKPSLRRKRIFVKEYIRHAKGRLVLVSAHYRLSWARS